MALHRFLGPPLHLKVLVACLGKKVHDVVGDAEGVEVAVRIESEEAFFARRHGGAGDDVVVADDIRVFVAVG